MENDKRIDLYRRLIRSPDGQQLLTDLVEDARIETGYFHADPYLHAYRSGYADCVRRIMRLANSEKEETPEEK